MSIPRASKSQLQALAEELVAPECERLEERIDTARAVLVEACGASWAKQQQDLTIFAEKLRAEILGELARLIEPVRQEQVGLRRNSAEILQGVALERESLRSLVQGESKAFTRIAEEIREQTHAIPTQQTVKDVIARSAQVLAQAEELKSGLETIISSFTGKVQAESRRVKGELETRLGQKEEQLQRFADQARHLAQDALKQWGAQAETLGSTQKTFDVRLAKIEQQLEGMKMAASMFSSGKAQHVEKGQ